MPDKLAAVQAVIFTLLLCAASVTDLTKRIIPNWLCLGIAGVSIIGFTPVKLLGILIALPFLLAAVFFGGMGGCAMIGQTMINVKSSGARTRISTFLAGGYAQPWLTATTLPMLGLSVLVGIVVLANIVRGDRHVVMLP